MNQYEFEAITSNRRKGRENTRVQVSIGLVFIAGLKSGASFAHQSQSEAMQNKRNLLSAPNWKPF